MATTQNTLEAIVQAYRAGHHDQAARICRDALASDRDNADLWCLLGIICRAQGALNDAAAHQREALRLRPQFLEALNNLGNVLVLQKQYQEAIECYQRVLAIRPDYPEAYSNLGSALRGLGRLDEAVMNYRQALRLRPEFPDALGNLGDALTAQGKPEEAIASYRDALRLAPAHVLALTGFGNALGKLERFEEALGYHQEALRHAPRNADVHTNLGNALVGLRRFDEALACYHRALQTDPNLAVGYFNQGIAFAELGRLDDALASYKQAIRLNPDKAEVWDNMATALLHQGKPEEALTHLEHAIAIDPESAKAHMNRALIWLLLGDYTRGWAEYEWRWGCKEFTRPAFPQPSWDGSELNGRTILLYAEQGLGDTLQIIRYASLVKQRGGRVIVASQKALLPILARTPGIDLLMANDAKPPACDVHAPLMSLPRLFGTTIDTVPSEIPYLYPDPTLVETWRQRLGRQRGLRIGIAWQGNPGFPGDHLRSFALAEFAPIARQEGVQLISLQKGAGVEQLKEVADRISVIDLGSTIDEAAGPFMDSAAIMRNLDLVICPNTALAHLAGGLGVPVWIPLPYAPEWRWHWQRDDSPWYPTARLFRQSHPGDWTGVFERIADALRMCRPMRRTRPVVVEISAADLIDKITILELKEARTADPAERSQIQKELAALIEARDNALEPSDELTQLTAELSAVNEALCDIEDEMRACERDADFGPRFSALARSAYHRNGQRADLKRRIGESLDSV